MKKAALFQTRSPGDAAEAPLVEPSLFYDPPYERPLEDEFAWQNTGPFRIL